jgi:hypothetical protein
MKPGCFSRGMLYGKVALKALVISEQPYVTLCHDLCRVGGVKSNPPFDTFIYIQVHRHLCNKIKF